MSVRLVQSKNLLRVTGIPKLTVRSSEEKLAPSGLPYQSERPPSYFAIKVQEDRDVESALKRLSLADQS